MAAVFAELHAREILLVSANPEPDVHPETVTPGAPRAGGAGANPT